MQDRLIIETLEVGPFATNCYVLGKKGGPAFIVDPADELEKIRAIIKRHEFKPQFIINTHGHIDHIKEDASFDLPVFIHSQDKPLLTDPALNLSAFLFTPFVIDDKVEIKTLEDASLLDFNGSKLEIIHTPGHTRGGICIKFKQYLFSGDTLFCRSIGRTDFKGGDYDQIIASIREKLFPLKEDLIVLPGHGPKTTLDEERKENPFLSQGYG
jgi:glyoxylase-like metal-dependent hydrolase (beta-lactamase superfamily II)